MALATLPYVNISLLCMTLFHQDQTVSEANGKCRMGYLRNLSLERLLSCCFLFVCFMSVPLSRTDYEINLT